MLALTNTASSCLAVSSTLDNLRSTPPPFELVRTERGGEVTYHGPGQLVVYPVLDLRAYRQDVNWYMRSLEEVALRTVQSLGLYPHRVPGLTGVWVGDAKLCAIGVKLSRWVTMHGLALNVEVDLDHFEHIVPCGIADRSVTSIRAELGARNPLIERPEELMDRAQALLLGHFGDVFGAHLCAGEPRCAEEALIASRRAADQSSTGAVPPLARGAVPPLARGAVPPLVGSATASQTRATSARSRGGGVAMNLDLATSHDTDSIHVAALILAAYLSGYVSEGYEPHCL